VLPRVEFERDAITWRIAGDEPTYERGGLGVLEPPESALIVESASIDLVLVPAVAVDDRGHRLGHGKGFYDRALREMPNARRCAVVFDFQRLAELPNTAGDEKMHIVVTDRGTFEITPASQ
jgi:5-formyltetrahydrofolate cyclo-ligase